MFEILKNTLPGAQAPKHDTLASGLAPSTPDRAPAFIGWQVTLYDIVRHVSSHSGEAGSKLLYSVYLLTHLQY